MLGDLRDATVWTPHPTGPAQLANGFVALDIIQQIWKVDHRRGAVVAAVENPFSVPPDIRRDELLSTVWNPY